MTQFSTSPFAAGQAVAAGVSAGQTLTGPPSNMQAAAVEVATTSGVATQYWFELVPIPAANPRLWLLVNNAWKRLDNASASILDIVQRAFLGTGNVRAWYNDGTIVGLVVEGS